MSKRRAAFLTLGCKVNQYETDAMEEILEKAGYEIVSFKETADVYIINTCSVTNMADRKSRQMIHRAKKNNPDAIIVAAGKKWGGILLFGSGVLCAGSRGRTGKEK